MAPSLSDVQGSPDLIPVRVTKVLDGDTVQVQYGPEGQQVTKDVRLAGIDTPETGKDWLNKPDEPLAQDARNALTRDLCVPDDPTQFLDGAQMYWPGQATDAHGRPIAYIFDGAGRQVNWDMVNQGYSPYVTNPAMGGVPAVWEDDYVKAMEGAIRDTNNGKETIYSPGQMRIYAANHGLQSLGGNPGTRQALEGLPDGTVQLLKLPPKAAKFAPRPFPSATSVGDSLKYASGGLKLGATWLSLPPEAIQIKTDNEIVTHRLLRSPGSLAERSGYSQTMISIQGKLDTAQAGETLLPILAQFACCPFLPVRNKDLERHLFDRGIMFSSGMGDSEAARQAVSLIQQKMDNELWGIRNQVDAMRSEIAPEKYLGLVGAYAEQICAVAKESSSRNVDDALDDFDRSFIKKLGSSMPYGLQWLSMGDNTYTVLTQQLVLKGDESGQGTWGPEIMGTKWNGVRSLTGARFSSMAQAQQQRHIDSFKDAVYAITRYKWALENAARDWTFPLNDVRMSEVWVALASFGATPLTGAPGALSFNLVLQVFNYLPYTTSMGFKNFSGDSEKRAESPESSAPFSAVWPGLITPVAADLSSTFTGLTFLKPPSSGWGERDIALSIIERGGINPPETPQIKARIKFTQKPDSCAYSYTGDFAQLPIEGDRYPTLQWLGMGTSTAQLSFMTDDTDLLGAIKDFDNAAALMCRKYERRMRQFYFVIEDPFLNAMGLTSCDLASFTTSSVGAGHWRVELGLHGTIPKLYELSSTHAVRDENNVTAMRSAMEWCLNHPDSCDTARDIWKKVVGVPDQIPAHKGLAGVVKGSTGGVSPSPEIRQMLARVNGDSQDNHKNTPPPEALRTLIDDYESVLDELQARRRPVNDNGVITVSSDHRFDSTHYKNFELQGLRMDMENIIDPIAESLQRAAVAITSQPAELQRILGGLAGLMAIGDYWNRNLYRDFPVRPVSELQAKGLAQPQRFFNADAWKMDVESLAFLCDPWFFLQTTSRFSEDGGPSEMPMQHEIIARNLVSRANPGTPPSSLHVADDVWDTTEKAKKSGGIYRQIQDQLHSNQVDQSAMVKLAKEMGYWDLASFMDYQNIGNVNPSESTVIRSKMLKSLESARWQQKGIAGAMPTFWMAFIERDNPEIGLFDDFYDYQALESLAIVRRKWGAADVAYVTVSNLFGNLGSPGGGIQPGAGLERHGMAEGTSRENPGLERGYYPLQVGTQVIIKVGYGNNVNKLETVFTGQVAEVTEGTTMELILQGYGAELLEPIAANTTQLYIGQATARELAEIMLCQPQVQHFGRSKIYGLLERIILGPEMLSTIRPEDMLMHSKCGQLLANSDKGISELHAGELQSRWFNFKKDPFSAENESRSIHDVNIFLPNESDNGVIGCQTPARRYEPFIIAGETAWGVLQDVAMDHPGIALAVRPYDGRATLFMGNPELDYIQSSRALWNVNLANLGRKLDDRAANPRPFRRYHMARSGVNLVRNNLEITKEFYNEVSVGWRAADMSTFADMTFGNNGGFSVNVRSNQPGMNGVNPFSGNLSNTSWGNHDSSPGVPCLLALDTGINPEDRRALFVDRRNATNRSRALRQAISILGENVSHAYKGSIWMRSDVDIWPWDIVMLVDEANQMYGAVEVDEAILHFDRELGYVYELKPNCMVTMQNYTTREMLHANTMYNLPDGRIEAFKDGDSRDPLKSKGRGDPKDMAGTSWGSLFSAIWYRTTRAVFRPIATIANEMTHGTNDSYLSLEAQGKIEAYSEMSFAAIANHPISVFPLNYQGRPWWPLAHRGSLIDSLTESAATPDVGAGADSRQVALFNNIGVAYQTFRGFYNNAVKKAKETN